MDWNIQTFRRIALEEVLSFSVFYFIFLLCHLFHSISLSYFNFFFGFMMGCFSMTKMKERKRNSNSSFFLFVLFETAIKLVFYVDR